VPTTKNTAAQDAAPRAETMRITPLPMERLLVPIVGISPFVCHNFSEKSRRQMLDAQQGTKNVKRIRDPQAEYETSFYRIYDEDGKARYGFPTVGFKGATISAARVFDKSVTMTSLRQTLFFSGVRTKGDPQTLTEIIGTPQMREDVVRLGGMARTADLRYRAEFEEWSATLDVAFVSSVISRDSVLSILDAGGLTVGIGEWRPEKGGDLGRYTIDETREVLSIGLKG